MGVGGWGMLTICRVE